MIGVKLPYMKLVGSVWWTNGAHAGLGLRPNGRNKAQCASTGIKAGNIEAAASFSKHYGEFISNKEWHTPAKYREARERHEQAAEIFYRPWKANAPASDDYLTLMAMDMMKTEPTPELEQFIKERTARESAQVRLVEAEAVIETLKKELGKTVAGADVELRKVANEYLEYGRLKGGKGGRPWAPDHERKRVQQLTFWCGKFKRLSDISMTAVEAEQTKLAATMKGKTVNHYTECIRALCEWARTRKLYRQNPLEDFTPLHDDSDDEKWRPLTLLEVEALLKHCKPERRIVYELSICGGFRRGELGKFLVRDFDQKNGGILIQPGAQKNRKLEFQALPDWLVEKLAVLVEGKAKTDPLVYMCHDPHAAFLRDWALTGLPREGDGKVVTFHGLRKTAATWSDSTGASEGTTQKLLRHGSKEMTRRYIKVVNSDVKAAVEAIGALVRGA